jgi:hypothetical protein
MPHAAIHNAGSFFTFGDNCAVVRLKIEGAETMKQPHTEKTVRHTGDQQNTGTHKKPGAPDEKGADRFGGTRAGKENVEPATEQQDRKGQRPRQG